MRGRRRGERREKGEGGGGREEGEWIEEVNGKRRGWTGGGRWDCMTRKEKNQLMISFGYRWSH